MAILKFENLFTDRANRVKSSIIRELLKLGNQPGIISLGGGMPDPALFPVEKFRECMDIALKDYPSVSLQYGETPGYTPLRKALAELSKHDGITDVTEENILITSGSQQAIDFISKLFIQDGDTIILEAPSYLSAIQSFQTFGAKFQSISMDANGAKVDELETLLKKLKAEGIKPKFFYTIPTFQNPAGVTMPLERRKKLMQIASEYDLMIVEDNPYGDLRYSGEAVPAVKSMDPEGHVVYMRTFSKILAPGIRMGWIVAPTEVIAKINLVKQATDLCSPIHTQVAINEYLNRDYLWPHVETIKKAYAHKCAVMVKAVKDYFPPEIKVNTPEGGMFLWAEAPDYINTVDIFKDALANGVAYIVGNAFYPDGKGTNTMRLNFTMSSPEKIEEAIKRLGSLLKAKIR